MKLILHKKKIDSLENYQSPKIILILIKLNQSKMNKNNIIRKSKIVSLHTLYHFYRNFELQIIFVN